ncbi:MAG TPA: T9SS type A sorting domain-containing protein, partial [Ignavibacteriaceae bacterium]
ANGLFGGVVPVELISFNATQYGNDVILEWQTASETNNSGFEIEKTSPIPSPYQGGSGEAGRGWDMIGFVPGYGTTTERHHYSFNDENVSSGLNQYRLKQIDFDGTFSYSNTVQVEIIAPSEFQLYQNYPNPFNPSTLISYQIPISSNVTLKIYDALGKEVAILVNENKPAGTYDVEFNASILPSGVYFYQIKADNFLQTKKMLLLK